MKKKWRIFTEIGQWLSAGIVLAGIACEVKYKADVYLVAITVGTFFWSVVQKLKHPTPKE